MTRRHHFRIWGWVPVFVPLLAACSDLGPPSSGEQTGVAKYGVLGEGAADTVVTSDAARKLAWESVLRSRYTPEERVLVAFELAYVNAAYAGSRNPDPAALRKEVEGVRRLVDEAFRSDYSRAVDTLEGGIDLLFNLHSTIAKFAPSQGGAPVGKIYGEAVVQLKRLADSALADARAEGALQDAVVKSLFQERIAQDRLFDKAATLFWECANGDAASSANCARAGDLVTNERMPFGVLTSLPEMRAADADLDQRLSLYEVATELGGMRFDITKLKDASLQLVNNLATLRADQLTFARSTNALLRDIAGYIKDQERRRQRGAEAAALRGEHRTRVQAANASVYLLSTLIGFSDPRLARDLATVGNAGVQIYDAIGSFLLNTKGNPGGNALLSQSGLIMTANVAGAVMSLLPLFTGAGQQDSGVLSAVAALRRELRELRTEIHERFDRVDLALNQIYGTMLAEFDKIDTRLGLLTEFVGGIQERLVDVQSELRRIENDLWHAIGDGSRRDLVADMNNALGFKENFGIEMPYSPDYIGHESLYQAWATRNAFDAVSTGPSLTARPVDDDHLLAELDRFPLDANIGWINRVVSENPAWRLPPFASGQLPNPTDWTMAARAYAQLGNEWPAHAGRVNATRAAAVTSVGERLRTALRSIAAGTNDSGAIVANPSYLRRAVDQYLAKTDELGEAIAADERRFGARSPRLPDLFGGTDQALTSNEQWPYPGSMNPCEPLVDDGLPPDGMSPTLPTPGSLGSALAVPVVVQLARHIGLGQVDFCYRAAWRNEREVGTSRRARLEVTVVVRHEKQDVRQFLVSTAERTSCIFPRDTPCYSPYRILRINWSSVFGDIRGEYDRAQKTSTDNASVLSDIEAAVRSYLAARQKQFFAETVTSLAGGALQRSAVRLDGTKALLRSLLVLGMPRALQSDELLRALLFGDVQLFDERDRALQTFYVVAATELDAGLRTPAQNPRHQLIRMMKERAEALALVIEEDLGLVGRDGYVDSDLALEGTLVALRTSQRNARHALVTVDANALDFGRLEVGTAASTRSVTLTNLGPMTALDARSPTVAGTQAADFTVAGCPEPVAAGASCTLTISFTPGGKGVRTATVLVGRNAVGEAAIDLRGEGFVNTAPVAANDDYLTDEDVPLTVTTPGLLANDADQDAGDTLSADAVSRPLNGSLQLARDGSFTYVPNPDFFGGDAFTYVVRDSAGKTSAEATVTITVRPVNDPPVAANDAYRATRNTTLQVAAPGVLANDVDIDGVRSVVLASPPANGTVMLAPDGGFVYTPARGFVGMDSFGYRVRDDAGALSDVATVAITVRTAVPVRPAVATARARALAWVRGLLSRVRELVRM